MGKSSSRMASWVFYASGLRLWKNNAFASLERNDRQIKASPRWLTISMWQFGSYDFLLSRCSGWDARFILRRPRRHRWMMRCNSSCWGVGRCMPGRGVHDHLFVPAGNMQIVMTLVIHTPKMFGERYDYSGAHDREISRRTSEGLIMSLSDTELRESGDGWGAWNEG